MNLLTNFSMSKMSRMVRLTAFQMLLARFSLLFFISQCFVHFIFYKFMHLVSHTDIICKQLCETAL